MRAGGDTRIRKGLGLPAAADSEIGRNATRRRRRSRTAGDAGQTVYVQTILLLLGAFTIAVSFNLFLLPSGIASGGVTGVSILVERLLGLTPAITQWALNIPLFLLGLWLLGRRFAVKTILGSLVLPLLVLLTSQWPPPTHNPLLAAIYGGIGVGIGLGLVFRAQSSTGGLDLAAQLLHRYTGLPLGLAVACLDGLVIAAAGFIISPENALYALIGLFVTSKTIDVVQTGLLVSKVAFIISAKTEEISEAILHELDRGLTKLTALGGYTGESRTVLMVVVGQNEVTRLKLLVQSVDASAFVIISDTAEVLGEGFRR